LYVLDYYCHSFGCPPFDFFMQLADRIFIISKGVFLSFPRLSFFRTTGIASGFPTIAM